MKHTLSPDDDDDDEGRLDHTARRVRRLLEQPTGRVPWAEMLPELQNEVFWIMQRRAQRGEVEWTTALAMLRRTALSEWHRHVPPLPEEAVGRGTTIPKIASIAAMLAAPLRAGDWALFQELVAWRTAAGNPVDLMIDYNYTMEPVHNALGYQSNPVLFERFVALAGAGTMLRKEKKKFLSAVIQGVCERGTNTAWFKELASRIRSLPFQEMRSVASNCARYGQLEWLRYLHANSCPWEAGTCEHAAKGGHLDCLRYARENGCPWDAWTCTRAAAGGHLDCLRYAHENGCPWDKWTCTWAAEGGHLDCLRYAHENGCPWDKWTCAAAAEGGHLDCLRYAHENQCPWETGTCEHAAEGGHLDCLRYAIEAGCPVPWTGAMDIVLAGYTPEIREYLTMLFE